MKNFFFIFSLIILTLLQTKLYFHSGFPYTHDGENHLARFVNYKVALKEGQMPPRFAPNLLNHYGYPVFNFNYPLANIFSLPFTFFKINPETSFKVLVVFAVFLGGYFCKKWLKSRVKSYIAKIIGVSVFLLSPFLISAIYFRGNIGEILGYLFLPFIFWTVDSIPKNQRIVWWHIVGLVAFLLSHNLTVVIFLPILLLYSLFSLKGKRKYWKIWFFQWLMAFLLTAWFWIPALMEKGQTVVNDVNLVQEFSQHFVTLQQLFFSPIQFGFSLPGFIDTLGFSLGLSSFFALLLGIPACLILLLYHQKRTAREVTFIFSILLILGLILFQLPISSTLWNLFPALKIVQFPWRLTLFAMPLLAYISAFLADRYGKWMQLIFALSILFQIVGLIKTKPVDYFHKQIRDYEAFSQTTSTQNENTVKTFTYQGFSDWQPAPIISPNTGQIEVVSWNGTERFYKLRLKNESVVIEPTMYFSGWETKLQKNEKFVDWQNVVYINNSLTQGRIAYILPSGEYLIHTRFTQNTIPRIVGNGLFVVGIIFSLIIYTKGRKIKNDK